jgi:hypothetical protein
MTDSTGGSASGGAPNPNPNLKTGTKKSGGSSFPLIVGVLALIAGGAGFGYGYMQTFVPIEGGAAGFFGGGLKHQYFIKSRVGDRSPYNVTINLNGHNVGTVSTDKVMEVTQYVVKDRNKIRFESKRLPDGMFGATGAYIDISLNSGKGTPDGGFTDGQPLVKYERTSNDKGDFDDKMDWTTVNE